jgi:hypothetical protein
MIPQQRIPTQFTPLQQELLSLYSQKISDNDLVAINKLINNYFMDKLQQKVSEAAQKLGYTQDDFDSWLNDPNQ